MFPTYKPVVLLTSMLLVVFAACNSNRADSEKVAADIVLAETNQQAPAANNSRK